MRIAPNSCSLYPLTDSVEQAMAVAPSINLASFRAFEKHTGSYNYSKADRLITPEAAAALAEEVKDYVGKNPQLVKARQLDPGSTEAHKAFFGCEPGYGYLVFGQQQDVQLKACPKLEWFVQYLGEKMEMEARKVVVNFLPPGSMTALHNDNARTPATSVAMTLEGHGEFYVWDGQRSEGVNYPVHPGDAVKLTMRPTGDGRFHTPSHAGLNPHDELRISVAMLYAPTA